MRWPFLLSWQHCLNPNLARIGKAIKFLNLLLFKTVGSKVVSISALRSNIVKTACHRGNFPPSPPRFCGSKQGNLCLTVSAIRLNGIATFKKPEARPVSTWETLLSKRRIQTGGRALEPPSLHRLILSALGGMMLSACDKISTNWGSWRGGHHWPAPETRTLFPPTLTSSVAQLHENNVGHQNRTSKYMDTQNYALVPTSEILWEIAKDWIFASPCSPFVSIKQDFWTPLNHPTPLFDEALRYLPVFRIRWLAPYQQHIIQRIWIPKTQYI
jgi:hypothetical protein